MGYNKLNCINQIILKLPHHFMRPKPQITSIDQIRKHIKTARVKSRNSLKSCADELNIPLGRYTAYESGAIIPSLPEIELLAYYLKAPILDIISEQEETYPFYTSDFPGGYVDFFLHLRHKMIGAKLRQLREEKQISPSQLADQAGFLVEDLESFELGQTPIRLSILFRMLEVLNCSLLDIIDQTSLIGKWHQDASSIKLFFRLPRNVQSALLHSENQKYLEFIQKLLCASENDIDNLTQALKSLLSEPV